jgi:hypothetical protein
MGAGFMLLWDRGVLQDLYILQVLQERPIDGCGMPSAAADFMLPWGREVLQDLHNFKGLTRTPNKRLWHA